MFTEEVGGHDSKRFSHLATVEPVHILMGTDREWELMSHVLK